MLYKQLFLIHSLNIIADILPIVDHGKLETKRVCDHHRSERKRKRTENDHWWQLDMIL